MNFYLSHWKSKAMSNLKHLPLVAICACRNELLKNLLKEVPIMGKHNNKAKISWFIYPNTKI